MSMNCDYDSVVGVILPVKNKILPILHLISKLTKTLMVIKMAALPLHIEKVERGGGKWCVPTPPPPTPFIYII